MKRMIGILLLSLFCSTAYAQQNASATIWFYRPADAAGASRTVYRVGGITDRIATIEPGQFFGLPVTPGVHTFSYTQAPARGQLVAVSVLAGQQAYVEIQSDSIQMATPEKGIAAIQSSKPIPENNAVSNAVLVPNAAPAVSAAVPVAVAGPAPSPVMTTQPAATQSGAQQEPSDPNEFRRFEINWNLLSYQRQGQANLGGGTLGLTINANETVGIVADLGIHQQTVDGIDLTVTTYRFGPKFSSRINRRVTLFTQILAGGVRVRGDVSGGFSGSFVTVGAAGNGFSIFGGGGLDIGIRPWFAIRAIEGGYSGLYVGDIAGTPLGWSNGGRVSGGIVFRFGKD